MNPNSKMCITPKGCAYMAFKNLGLNINGNEVFEDFWMLFTGYLLNIDSAGCIAEMPFDISGYSHTESVIVKILTEICSPIGNCGFRYLVDAIMFVLQDDTSLSSFYNRVLGAVAKKYNTKITNVERCIRTTIEYIFDKNEYDDLITFFGNTIDVDSGKVTCKNFVARVSYLVKERISGENGGFGND